MTVVECVRGSIARSLGLAYYTNLPPGTAEDAIRALREPTPAMVEAACAGGDIGAERVRVIWRAMLDIALTE